jgi:myo-inositol-1(or 4)-monophosphatase
MVQLRGVVSAVALQSIVLGSADGLDFATQRRQRLTMGYMAEVPVIRDCAEQAARAAGQLIRAGRGAAVRATKANARDLVTEVDGQCQAAIEALVAARFPGHRFLGEEAVEAGPEASAAALAQSLELSGWLWVVDPIDGTTNFASGLPLSAVSIGVAFAGEVIVGIIYDPYQDELFSAIKGTGCFCNGAVVRSRRCGSLGEAVVFAGSPPSTTSMRPSLRGITHLMPRVRTVRLVGSAALMLAWVAAGRADAYFEADLNSWDTAAGALLIGEAGGAVVDLHSMAPYGLGTRRILAVGDAALLPALHSELDLAEATRPDPK